MARLQIIPLFNLSQDSYFRLSYDSHQWMIERRNLLVPKKGTDRGYRGISYVAKNKWVLLRDCKENEVPLTWGASLRLNLLPDHFRDFRTEIERLGVEAYLNRLEYQVRECLDRTEVTEIKLRAAERKEHSIRHRNFITRSSSSRIIHLGEGEKSPRSRL